MKTVYYIAITRDDNREFLYSTEIYEKELSDEDYEYLRLDELNVAMYLAPEDSKIIVVSRSKECVDAFLTGISFEAHKEAEWNDMFDEFIAEKFQH